MKSLKPIRTEAEYNEALAAIEEHFDAAAGTREGDFIEVLSILIEDYERKNFPISLPDPIEAILYHLETRGLDRKCLEPYIGARGRVSEVLNKKRPLSMQMIRKIHEGLGIPLEILLQKYMDEPEHSAPKVEEAITIFSLNLKEQTWLVPASGARITGLPDTRRVLRACSNKRSRTVARATYPNQ